MNRQGALANREGNEQLGAVYRVERVIQVIHFHWRTNPGVGVTHLDVIVHQIYRLFDFTGAQADVVVEFEIHISPFHHCVEVAAGAGAKNLRHHLGVFGDIRAQLQAKAGIGFEGHLVGDAAIAETADVTVGVRIIMNGGANCEKAVKLNSMGGRSGQRGANGRQ